MWWEYSELQVQNLSLKLVFLQKSGGENNPESIVRPVVGIWIVGGGLELDWARAGLLERVARRANPTRWLAVRVGTLGLPMWQLALGLH